MNTKTTQLSRFTASLSIAALVSSSCGGNKSSQTAPPLPTASPLSDKVLVQAKDLPKGLDLRLSNGHAGAPAFDHSKLAAAKKLSDADAEQLLSRANPIKFDVDDQQAFALRPGSQPPPRTGPTITASFPPPASSLLPPKANETGKDLRVLRWMPEGAVPVAPELSVTFSQPMVAVTSQEDAAATVPVKLTPTPKGKWRWLGTRTVLFDPDPRFPQATTYQVEIPAGTKSATGGVLRDGVKFTFETPPPKVEEFYPSGGAQRLDVPMFVRFDQRVDPAAVLAHVHVTADSKPVAIEALDAGAIAKNKQVAALVDAAKKADQDGRWVAFHATAELPKAATIAVTYGKGTPSAEGPNLTTADQTESFVTYKPLILELGACGWGGECRPGMPFSFTFNNPLDADKFDDGSITIKPEIPNAKIIQSYNGISIVGMTQAHTTYAVTMPSRLTDEFGQTLGKDETRKFSVGDAYPTFFGPEGMDVLDPAAAKPTLDFFTTNYEQLRVKIYAVDPSDYDAYNRYQRDRWNHDHPPTMPGHKVFDSLVATSHGKDTLVETAIDVSSALHHGLGHAIAVVQPYPWKESYEPPTVITWVQATKLAVDAYVDGDRMVAFTSDLATGRPASGVSLEIRPFGITATSDDKGLASLPLSTRSIKGSHFLVARRGDDVALLSDNSGYWNDEGQWTKREPGKSLAWYVTDDRKLYKPGEDVHLKGWLRLVDLGKGGDVGGLDGAVTGVTYTVTDSSGNQIGKGSATINAIGGFDTSFTLPKTPNLGQAYVQFESQGRLHEGSTHDIRVEEFRRPEFEVSTQASTGPFVIGGSGDVTVNAKYYAGGPLPGAAVNWQVTAQRTTFTPPNRDDYVFGEWQPWWGPVLDEDGEVGDGRMYGRGYQPPKTWTWQGKTDATGEHDLQLDFLSANPAVPMSVTANASVTDVNRQQWSSSSTLIVHPATRYVGVKVKRPFVDKGQPFDLDVIGVDLDGKATPGAAIEVKAVRLDWQFKKGTYRQIDVDPQTCAVTSAVEAVPCHFATKDGGTYRVTATIVDDKGRTNQTTLEFWVAGGEEPPAREVKQELVQLIPDRKDYAHGQTAEILVRAPFAPSEGVVTWRRSGIVHVERVTLAGSSTTLHVPIEDAMVPDLTVQVDLIGAAPRTDDHGVPDTSLPKRPAYAVGSLHLSIPPTQRALKVEVAPSTPKVGPGEAAHITVTVHDAAGRPVPNAEAAVIVVDEAVLSLTGYQFADPIDTFYPQRGPGASDYYERAYVKLAKPSADNLQTAYTGNGPGGRGAAAGSSTGMALDESIAAPSPKPPPAAAPTRRMSEGMMGKKERLFDFEAKFADKNKHEDHTGGKASDNTTPIAIRTNFNPLAAFSPEVHTGADGRATVDLKVPDNLTRYRVVAIAVAGDKQFGKGESSLTARLPLMVRPSPPRFLNFGDTFKLPIVVQNQTDAPMTVRVAVRAANASITDGEGRELSVPPNDRVEVQFPAAADLAGTARFQIVGTNGKDSDAQELALPVWTPATTEAFATYGVIDDGATRQPVALPEKVVTQFGGLEVSTSSTNLQAVTDALLYLVHYPFECAEQRSSRILAIATLRDVLEAFKAKDMPSRQDMEKSVAVDIEHLSQMQNYDGGFAYWDRGYPSEPYLTVFVANALGRAKAKGFDVRKDVLDRALPYLRSIEQHYPSYYPEDIRRAISAFALYTRKQLGDSDIAKGKRLFASWGVDKVSMETDGWLLGLFAGDANAAAERKAIMRYAMNHVSETAGAANFTTGYADGSYLILSSDRRVDGVMLESLIQEQKDSDLIPKLVTGLLAHRKAGHWLNTQENAFILQALDLYFNTYEKVTPDFVARVWLGRDYAGDHAFKGHTTERFEIDIPMKDVATHDKADLTLQKDGPGRLYYRLGMTYAPASLKLEPADYGFVVERRYEGADDPKDVTRAADGTWHIKAGARVRVRLKMVNENRRYMVALVDPLPAGLEALNPALATTGPIPLDPSEQKSRGAYWWWYGPWYEHQNLRDERVEAFASLLWEGVHDYTYVARATTPGNFVVPPPKAEEMYMPETFGRGGSDRVIVE